MQHSEKEMSRKVHANMLTKDDVLTKTERDLINAMKLTDTVAFAAQKIGIKKGHAYNILLRLRRKYLRARRLVNTLDPIKGRHDLIMMVLTDRMEQKILSEDAKEED